MSAGSGAHRTALLLHTLVPADRQSLLAQFDAAQRVLLDKLLLELDSLGIPRDRALLDQTMAALPVQDQARGAGAQASLIAALQEAQVPTLLGVLAEEPAELIASLLACAQWRWAAALLAALDPFKRRQVQTLMHDGYAPAPRLVDALLNAVCAALRDAVPGQYVPQPVKRHPLMQLLSRWRGAGGANT